jgi:hypothetical protein
MPKVESGVPKHVATVSLLAIACFFTAKGGLAFAIPPGNATTVSID